MANEKNINVDTQLSHATLLHLTMFMSIVAAVAASTSTIAHDESSVLDQLPPAIPFCDTSQDHSIGRRLLYVTTLDGRLSALDISKGGKLRWSIPTGPGPLISSSIHRLELTNNGQFVRMIPSLSGGIYKFDGESIDPIPITTENLLSSSTKFSDDLVISGGKETRTYGVCVRTGNLLYECSMHGCINSTTLRTTSATVARSSRSRDNEESINYLMEHDPSVDDVIIVRRQTQTIRAVESRTGVERWNFSVGQHELDLKRSSECHDRPRTDMDIAMLDIDIRVIVPDGIVCAFSKTDPNTMLWKHQFDHPIVSGWKMSDSDQLEAIDMFGSTQWFWDHEDNMFDPPDPSVSPSIYLGMYEKQLYIQESVGIRRQIYGESDLYTHLTTESSMPKIPWRPIPASSSSLVVFQDENVINMGTQSPLSNNDIRGNELVPYRSQEFALSAQSVLNGSEYVNGNGFYLYSNNDLNKTHHSLCDKNHVPALEDSSKSHNSVPKSNLTDDLGFSLDDIDAPVKVVILSLWFWWKEIVVIAFTSAVLLNLLIGQRSRGEREIVVIERHIPVPTAIEATEASTAALLGPTNSSSKNNGTGISYLNGYRTLSESTNHSGENFTSRFQSDFDLMRCLGRGGFGVVFEAKNKLDDCKYAVKRITLPNKKESRERVMREVKTLANCEHHNIVRYFQAWVETPPPGWQEEEDNKWMQHEMSTSIQIETPDGTTLPSTASEMYVLNHDKGHLQSEKKKQLMSWVSSVASTACSSDFDSHMRDIEEEDDDSCIVFRSESQSMEMKQQEDDGKCIYSTGYTEQSPGSDPLQQNQKSVEIDIHSNNIEFIQNCRNNFNFSQLSDSFQIEFVRSMNEKTEWVDDNVMAAEDLKTTVEKSKSNQCKRRTRSTSLNLTNESNNNNNRNDNNNCKALVPAFLDTSTPLKPSQNKVYLYIQMQLCRKECLRDWLRENKPEARESHIASIFHQIVDAVDYVHLKGLIHRDLKPSNIFFSQDGQIKIGDFGLVTDMSDIPNLITKCGDKSGLPSCARHTQQVGTHLYMSPEQLQGKHYDHKVDIYSLGLIFFELLVFFGTEMERIVTLRDLRDGRYPKNFPIERPSEFELLQQMLSTNPIERPSTPELKMQLNNILKLPEMIGDSEAVALAAAARRFGRSRTFSTNE